MLATGKLSAGAVKSASGPSEDSVLGLEFSGRDKSGRRVAGITSSCGMSTAVVVDPVMLIDVPDTWSLKEAATVPVVYATAYYGLVKRADICSGQSILIHSATGGVGIAATRIALSYKCEVFATVGNEEKRAYLRKLFPQIKEENIASSRDTEFENMVMKRTKGKGVDIVLNSLADDKFQASVRCVGKHGHFLEIGKYDLSLDRNLGLKLFLKNISFDAVMLDQLFDETPQNREKFHQVMNLVREGIQKGVVKPLDTTVFERDQIEQAFRYMSKVIHVGKVVLKVRDEEPTKNALPRTLELPAMPNTYFYPNKVYIVIGGLGGFGIEVTKWILGRGGKNIIITSRSGARLPYHKLCLGRWKNAGANVQVLSLNVANENEAVQLLKKASDIGPVGGIFNSAVVLKDGFMEHQTVAAYEEVCAPKSTATKILDKLSRKLCPALDLFVCFSSISCGRGNAGQTNYGYANSVMERICEQRRAAGLHGLAIQWGIIGEVGVVHRFAGDDAMIAGVRAQNVKSCLNALDLFCRGVHPVVCSYVTAVTVKKVAQKLDIISQLTKIIGFDNISETVALRRFGDMGIDSLTSVEITKLLESQLNMSLTVPELYEMKIDDIRKISKTSSGGQTSKVSESLPIISTVSFKLPLVLVSSDPVVSLNNETKGSPVFIISIGSTDVTDFKVLAENIGVPCFALLRTKSTPLSDIEALTASYLKVIQSKTDGEFNLIGYSFGGCIAFDIAVKEESKGHHLKSLTLLNGSKHLIKSLRKQNVTEETSSLCDFIGQFSSEAAAEVEDQLLQAKNLAERKEIILNLLISSSSQTFSKAELNETINDHLKLSKLINSYSPNKKLSKDILIVEDFFKVLPNDVADIKSSMSQFCSGKVIVNRQLSQKDLRSKERINVLVNLLKERF